MAKVPPRVQPYAAAPVRRSGAFPWLMAVGLGLLGLAVNLLFPVRLSPGTDILFGAVFYLLAAIALGPLPGMLAAAIASARTLWLWNHPYAWVIFSLEALVVGWLVQRWRIRPLLADLLYWLLGGVPLLFLTYYLVLDVRGYTAAVIFLKQPFNGLAAALVAEALLLFPLVRRWLRFRGAPQLRSTMAAVVALAAVLPALIFGIWIGRQEWDRNVERAEERVELFARAYAARLEQYVLLHDRAVRTVAQTAERRGAWQPEQLQRMLEAEREQFPGFVNLYAADADARTVAFAPRTNARGETLIGLDFSDREYYRELRRSREAVISGVFSGRGGTEQPLIVLAHPVVLADTLAGYVLGALDLDALPDPLPLGTAERLRVADAGGTVVVDSRSRYTSREAPRMLADSAEFRAIRELQGSGVVTYLPNRPVAAAAVTASQVLAGVARVPSLGWWVWVERPFTEVQRFVNTSYVRLLGLLIVVTLLALVVSELLSRFLATPLLRLRTAAGALAAGELQARVGRQPDSVPLELQQLGGDFDEMAETLTTRARELEQMTHAAQAASRAKSDFIATMSHELRTPLNAMLGHLELLEMGVHGEPNAAQARALERIGVATRHLRGLIEEVLSFARLEAGRVEVRLQPTDLFALAEEVATVVEPLVDEKGLELRVRRGDAADAAALVVETDADKVRQILINLIGNAVKFTERGSVEIRVHRTPEAAVLAVHDTGAGISEEDQARLFRAFEQLESGLDRPHGGTGLGLYLSARYAALLGGRIEVESEPGQGSTFSLILPLQPDEQKGEA